MNKKKFTRREFVSYAAAGTGTFLMSSFVKADGINSLSEQPDPLKKITLGKTGITTTLLGMGTGYNGYNRSSSITRAGVAEKVIRYAYDKGIRFFDCADAYGTHPFTGRALKDMPRENYTINTKIWLSPGALPEPERPDANIVVDRFRKELNTDYIDIVQIHLMTSGTWTDQHKRQMDIMDTLKSKGIIRAHGVSVHSLQAMEAAAASSWVDVIHVRINPFGASMDSSDPGAVTPVIERLHKSGKGVIAMKVFGNGTFKNDSEKLDQSLKFVLGLGTVDMIIIGFEQTDQVDNCMERMKKALKS
jgi:aryl-alcohol dehydrogenase-like predicted oxidoreductase